MKSCTQRHVVSTLFQIQMKIFSENLRVFCPSI